MKKIEMNNLYSFSEFLTEKNKLNEGLFSFLKGLFKDLKNYAKKVKEAGEIDKKIEAWKKEFDKIILDKAKDINPDFKPENFEKDEKELEKQQQQQQQSGVKEKKESFKSLGNDVKLIKEAEIRTDIPDMPDFIKNLGKAKSTGNPIDDAINQFLDNKKAELIPYINSDIKATRLYAYAKLAELNSDILQKKIKLYKATKGYEKEAKDAEQKLAAMQNDSKKIEEELKKAVEDKSTQFKEGDVVIYKREKWDKNAEEIWNKLSDEDKKNPDKLKELIDKGYVGKKSIEKISNDKIDFGDFTKNREEILVKLEGQVQGKDELVNTLKDLKTKNPDSIKKLNTIANLYKEPDKNKDKIAQIEKQLGED